MLTKYHVKATFFVLGFVADQHPELVQEIDAAGHEIGSHSYWHRRVYQISPAEFRTDLRRSREVLETIIQKPVTSYRAPSFSINNASAWALPILAEEGFTSDSSLMPTRSDKCNMPHFGRRPFTYEFAGRRLREFPLAVFRLGGKIGIPISGGGYFRLYPFELTMRLLNQINRQQRQPFAFYTHPWEFDPSQPRLQFGTRGQRFRHYVNLSRTKAKFEKLLMRFPFSRMDSVLAHHAQTFEMPIVQPGFVA